LVVPIDSKVSDKSIVAVECKYGKTRNNTECEGEAKSVRLNGGQSEVAGKASDVKQHKKWPSKRQQQRLPVKEVNQ
jgi:hypothetical protein